MKLVDLIPDPDALLALEPDELGFRMLPVLAAWRFPGNQLQRGSFISSIVGSDQLGGYPGQYPPNRRHEITLALTEAWAWLEGQAQLIPDPDRRWVGPHEIRMLSRKARRLATETDPRQALAPRRVPKNSLHPAIREDVWALYHRSKYDTAVFEAMKAVEVAVREASGLAAKDIGAPLMRKAFDVNSGPLTDATAEPSERQALSDLFAGTIGTYKNAQSHRKVGLDDPDEAAEIVMLANHLLRIVYARQPTGGAP